MSKRTLFLGLSTAALLTGGTVAYGLSGACLEIYCGNKGCDNDRRGCCTDTEYQQAGAFKCLSCPSGEGWTSSKNGTDTTPIMDGAKDTGCRCDNGFKWFSSEQKCGCETNADCGSTNKYCDANHTCQNCPGGEGWSSSITGGGDVTNIASCKCDSPNTLWMGTICMEPKVCSPACDECHKCDTKEGVCIVDTDKNGQSCGTNKNCNNGSCREECPTGTSWDGKQCVCGTWNDTYKAYVVSGNLTYSNGPEYHCVNQQHKMYVCSPNTKTTAINSLGLGNCWIEANIATVTVTLPSCVDLQHETWKILDSGTIANVSSSAKLQRCSTYTASASISGNETISSSGLSNFSSYKADNSNTCQLDYHFGQHAYNQQTIGKNSFSIKSYASTVSEACGKFFDSNARNRSAVNVYKNSIVLKKVN